MQPRGQTVADAIRHALKAASATIALWGALVGIGVAPTLGAVIAALTGSVTWLWGALVASLIANGLLAWQAIRLRRKMMRARIVYPDSLDERPAKTQWMRVPGDLSTMEVGIAHLEAAWELATSKVRAEVAPDTVVRLVKIGLGSSPAVEIQGWSNDAKVGVHAGAYLDGVAWVSAFRSDRKPFWYPRLGTDPLWRTDDSWRELVRRSWVRERPFRGGVSVAQVDPDGGPSYWQVEYLRKDGTIHHPVVRYRLVDGELERREGY